MRLWIADFMTEELYDVAWHPTECDPPGFFPGEDLSENRTA
jgi:hypothetical protein